MQLDSQQTIALYLAAMGIVFSITISLKEWRSKHYASPLMLLSLLISIHFYTPITLISLNAGRIFHNSANLQFLPEAAAYTLLCHLALLTGVYLTRLCIKPGRRAELHQPSIDNRRTVGFAVVLLALGYGARLYIIGEGPYHQNDRHSTGNIPESIFAAVMAAEQLPMLAAMIMIIAKSINSPISIFDARITTILIMELAYWLPTGRKEPVILGVVLPIALISILTRKAPNKVAIATIAAGAFLLFPIANMYRTEMILTGNKSSSIETAIQSITYIGRDTNGNGVPDSIEITVERLSLIEAVAACVRLIETNKWEPLYGASYSDAVINLIPRAWWKDKPNYHYGNEFGFSSGLTDRQDYTTSISVTYIGESYLNFGWLGFMVMAFIGIGFEVVYLQSITGRERCFWAIIYTISLPIILYVGGTFTLYFGQLIKTGILMTIAYYAILRCRNPRGMTCAV